VPKRLRARDSFGRKGLRRYDRAGRDRLDPDLLAYVHHSADEYRASRPDD
jgi:hypothetical protein